MGNRRGIRNPGRTVTEADIVMFAGLSGDYNPLHINEEYCKQTQFGGRIAHGPLVYAIAAGLLFQLHLYDDTLIAPRVLLPAARGLARSAAGAGRLTYYAWRNTLSA